MSANEQSSACSGNQRAFIYESLIEITDLIGEALAALEQKDEDSASVRAAFLKMWELRWELGMTGGPAITIPGERGES